MNLDTDFDVIHGSGNIYRDFGDADADTRQAKAILAAQIIIVLKKNCSSVQEVTEHTAIDEKELSRIHNANLQDFMIDRLMFILDELNQTNLTPKLSNFCGRTSSSI